jgi:hypothetical protein
MPLPLDQDPTAHRRLLARDGAGTHRRCREERHDGGAGRRGSRGRGRGSRTAAAGQLLHLAPAASPTMAGVLRIAAVIDCY